MRVAATLEQAQERRKAHALAQEAAKKAESDRTEALRGEAQRRAQTDLELERERQRLREYAQGRTTTKRGPVLVSTDLAPRVVAPDAIPDASKPLDRSSPTSTLDLMPQQSMQVHQSNRHTIMQDLDHVSLACLCVRCCAGPCASTSTTFRERCDGVQSCGSSSGSGTGGDTHRDAHPPYRAFAAAECAGAGAATPTQQPWQRRRPEGNSSSSDGSSSGGAAHSPCIALAVAESMIDRSRAFL